MEAKRAAGIIIFAENTCRYLMGERADGQGWGFAAGKQEDKDADLKDTALRELQEEFGVVLDDKLKEKICFQKTILCQYDRIDRLTRKAERRSILSDIFYLAVADEKQLIINDALKDDEMLAVSWQSLKAIANELYIFPPSLIALNTLPLNYGEM